MLRDYFYSIYSRGLLIFSNQLFVFILFVILSNSINVENFNEFASGIVLIQTFWFLSKYGIELYSIEIASSKKNDLNFLITNNFIVTLAFYLLFFITIIFFIKCNYINIKFSLLYSIMPAALLGGVYPVWFFQAIDKVDRLLRVNIISKILFLLIIFIFNDYLNLEIIFILFGLSFVPPVIAAYIYIFRHEFFYSFSSKINLIAFLKESTPYFFKNILCNQLNYIWLTAFLFFGPAFQIGVYTLADQFYKVLNVSSNFISQVLRVKLLKLKITENKYKVYKFYLALILVILTVSFFISFLFANYIFVNNLKGDTLPLNIFLLIFLFSSLSKYQIINNEKFFLKNMYPVFINFFIHFLLIFIGIIFSYNLYEYLILYLLASLFQYSYGIINYKCR